MLRETLIKELNSIHLEVKPNRYEDIFYLYQGNEAFAKLSHQYPTTMEYVKNEVEDVPPFTDREHKHFISLYETDQSLVAVLDIIEGYCFQQEDDVHALWIGLLMIHFHKQKTGLGRLIINQLFEACVKNKITTVQLGVIKENVNGLRFWKSIGFEVFKEGNNGEFDLVLMQKHL